MVIDFNQEFKDMEGESFIIGDNKKLDLRLVSVNSLTAPNDKLSGDEKLDRYVLACKIRSGGECDLSVEDIALIKKCVSTNPSPLIVGQAWEMLENKNV